MRIWTARYDNETIDNDVHAPLQASGSAPRHRLSFYLVGRVWVVAPPPGMCELPPHTFAQTYRAHLDRYGAGKINWLFSKLWEENLRKDLVLCCYEDLRTGAFCHRRSFAAWWHEQTGESIDELDEPRNPTEPKPEPDRQLKLF